MLDLLHEDIKEVIAMRSTSPVNEILFALDVINHCPFLRIPISFCLLLSVLACLFAATEARSQRVFSERAAQAEQYKEDELEVATSAGEPCTATHKKAKQPVSQQ